jgi:Flp pilus assembly CpaE family ATPase
MDKTNLNILLIEDSPEFAELVRHWIAGNVQQPALTLNWADTLRTGLQRLAQGGIDVILLDLGLPDRSGFQTFASIQARAPGIPIVILSADDSEPLALRAIQEGAEDYLVKSRCDPDLLLRTVMHAIVRHESRPRASSAQTRVQATVLGIFGAKGGVGTTTVACNLAAELRRQTGQKVLLTGLDFRAERASFLMGLQSRYSMRSAVAALDRLDRTFWDSLVARGPADLEVIPSTDPGEEDDLPLTALPQLLYRIRPFYQWIVLDLGQTNVRSMSLLDCVDNVLVVTTANLFALFEAKRLIDALAGAGLEDAQLGLIINEGIHKRSLPDGEISKILGVRLQARLPNVGNELEEACIQRTLPDENSRIRRQIGTVARQLAGVPEPALAGKRSWLPAIADMNSWHARAGKV